MYIEKKLENGLRIIICPMMGTKAVTVLVMTGAGSRYEAPEERGTAHFLEHMFFKGGNKFVNAKEVSESIDRIGGDFNAFTGKEYVGYYVKSASEYKETAFDVLSDMLLNATFAPLEIEKERGVILEEMNMYEDMPIYKVGWDFEELLFAGHPMALDSIGTKEVITSITQSDFQSYKNKWYTPDNTVIVVSGDIKEQETVDLVEKYFTFPHVSRTASSQPFTWNNDRRVFIRPKSTEQAHIVMGFPGYSHAHPKKNAKKILSILLGGNMSSRMFMNVREAKGLCYSINTSTDIYTDCGYLSTHAGVSIARTEEAISAIALEYEKIRTQMPEEEEIERAKSFLKGKMTLRMEDSESVANFLGSQSVLHLPTMTIDEYFAKIDTITADDVFSVAQDLFDPKNLHLSIIGPFDGKENTFQSLLTPSV